MGDILLPGEYDNVRALFGLDERELPDATLSLLPYGPSVEAQLKRRVPDWAAIIAAAGDDALHLKTACCYGVAAALCGRLANQFRPGDRLADSALGQIDWDAQERQCRAKMEEALGKIATQTRGEATLFRLAGVSRAVAARRQSVDGFENV